MSGERMHEWRGGGERWRGIWMSACRESMMWGRRADWWMEKDKRETSKSLSHLPEVTPGSLAIPTMHLCHSNIFWQGELLGNGFPFVDFIHGPHSHTIYPSVSELSQHGRKNKDICIKFVLEFLQEHVHSLKGMRPERYICNGCLI